MPSAGSARDQVSVTLPAALIALFPGCASELRLSAATVTEMIDRLDTLWPGMRDRLCDSTPGIRRHINIFVRGERASLSTVLAPGDEVLVMTAISGG